MPQPGVPAGPRQTVAPTPRATKIITHEKRAKGKRRRARRTARRAERTADRALATIKRSARKATPPEEALREARTGAEPPVELKKTAPRTYKRARRLASTAKIEEIRSHENLKEDPLAELAISTAATAGIGAGARLAGAAGKAGVEALSARLASKEVTAAEQAAEKGAKGIAARGARTKGGIKPQSRAGRAKASAKSRAARGRARRRIQPKARNRAKARARRKLEEKRLRYGREGRKVARRHRGVRLGQISPTLTATGAGVGTLGIVGADIEGHIQAFQKHPGEVTKRTLEIAPGLVVSTADLAAQAGVALGTGDTKGLQKRIEEEVGFAKDLVTTMASGDQKRVERFVEKNGLVAPLMLAPSLAKLGKPLGRVGFRPGELAPEGMRRAHRRRGVRKQSARDASREEAEALAEVQAAARPIAEAYHGRRGRKGVKGRRKIRSQPVDRGDLVALAAEEGLTPASARTSFPAIAEKWDRRPRFTDKKQGGVTGHDLVDLVRRDPKVWDDPAFWRTVEAYRKQEPDVRTSERVVDLEQAKTYGVQLAEHRSPPAAREHLPEASRASRAEVANFISKSGEGGKRVRGLRRTIRAAEGRARELRAELRQIEKADRLRQRRAGKVSRGARKGQPKVGPLQVMNRRRSQLLHVEADIRGMRAELAGTQERHRLISSSLRDPGQLEAATTEFAAELGAVRSDLGLKRGVYVPHTDVGTEGLPVAQPITRAGKKVYERSAEADSLAERGRVDYSLAAIVDAGVQAPRVRKHVHAFVNHQTHEGAITIPVKTPDGRIERRRVATREQFERGLTPEQKQQISLFPVSQFNQAVKDGSVKAMTDALEGLGREIDWAEDTKGVKYIAMDRNRGLELKEQVSAPGTGLHTLQVGSRGLSRVILASPAWAIAQVVAESLQASLSINPLNPMNIYHGIQGYRGLRRMSPERRREFRAVSGSMPGMGASPTRWLTVDKETHGRIAEAFKKAERSAPIKRLLQAVRLDWLKAIDRAKGGEIRVATAAVKAHKDAMGFGKRLERLFKGERAMSEKLSKMSLEERMEWSMRSTPAKRKLENYLDDVLGNWRALSRKERVSSPALIFYPFLRMSLQWPFYSFPKRHPLRAAVMYEMAAAHNSQLRALLGGPPPWFGDYATAIVYGEQYKGGALEISAKRIVPGANSIFEAITHGGDVAAQRSLNPVVSYFNALVNGIDPLTGEKVDPSYMSTEEKLIARAGLTASLLFNTAPPSRAIDQLIGPKEKTTLPIIGARREENALGKLLEDLNGSPEEQALQTLVNPFPMKDIDVARDRAAMGRIFEIWRTSGSDAQDAVIADKSLSKKQAKEKLKRMAARTAEADSELHRLYHKYGVAFEKEEEREQERYYELKYPDEEKTAVGKYAGGAAQSTNKYSGGGAEAAGGNKYAGG